MKLLEKISTTAQLRRSERSVILMPAAASRPVATFRQTAEKHRQTVEPFYQAAKPFYQTAGLPGHLAERFCQTVKLLRQLAESFCQMAELLCQAPFSTKNTPFQLR